MIVFQKRLSFVGALILALLVAGWGSLSHAASGAVHLRIAKVGFIVGVGGGSGTLTFKGKQYPFKVSGVSVGTIGVAQVDLVGSAAHLTRAQDIAGTYSAASAGIAVAGGVKGATLQNEKGVTLTLQGKQVGFDASLALSGMTISFP